MATYYVSTVDGNDSYNGLYPTYQGGSDGPWLTISKVNSSMASFNPGDSILFNRGNTWITSDYNGLQISRSGSEAGGYITFGAYGSGALPVLSHDGGDDQIAPAYLSVNNVAYIIVEYLDLRQAGAAGAAFAPRSGCNHIKVMHCNAQGKTGGISGDYLDTFEFGYNTITVTSGVGVNISGYITMAQNSWVHHNIIDDGADCISIHDDGENHNAGDNHTIEYNTIGGTTGPSENCIDIAVSHLDTIPTGIVIRGNICKGSNVGALGLNGNGTIVEYNFVYHGGNVNYEALVIGAGSSNFKIRYNIFTNAGQSSNAGIVFPDASPYTEDVEIYNNVIYHGSSGEVPPIVIPPGNSGITIKNNIFIDNYGRIVWYQSTATPDNTGSVLDYNCYYSTQGDTDKFRVGNDYYNFASWKSTWSQDAHSMFSDPLFVNTGENYSLDTDFQIPSNSPAKDAGTGVGLTKDYFGTTVPQGSAPDIGVHEYIEAEPIYLIWTK